MFDSSLVGDPFALFPIQAVGIENGIYLFVEHRNSHTLLNFGFPNHALFKSVVFHGTLVRPEDVKQGQNLFHIRRSLTSKGSRRNPVSTNASSLADNRARASQNLL